MPNTIVLKGDPLRKEALAGAALTPGDLIAFSSGAVIRHANSGQNAAARFAVENDLIGSGIADNYPSGDVVKFVLSRPGDEIYGLLASGQNVSQGDFLESDGSGCFQAYTNQSGQNVYVRAIVAAAAEDKDNSSGDADGPHDGATRIKLEVV
jgi:hypothetical protein